MSTPELTVMQFDTASEAELYHASQAGGFQVENIVVEFGPALSADQRAKYQNATVRALE